MRRRSPTIRRNSGSTRGAFGGKGPNPPWRAAERPFKSKLPPVSPRRARVRQSATKEEPMKALRLTAIVIVSAGIIASVIFLLTVTSCACGTVSPTGQPERIIGILRSAEQLLNVPGALCGYHYGLMVDVAGRGRQVFHVYDMGVSERSLSALKGRKV